MTAHDLKTWPEPFRAVLAGKKKHEVRFNDRAFQVGDTLHMREWDPTTKQYTGRDCKSVVTYLTEGGTFGLPARVCVMSIRKEIR